MQKFLFSLLACFFLLLLTVYGQKASISKKVKQHTFSDSVTVYYHISLTNPKEIHTIDFDAIEDEKIMRYELMYIVNMNAFIDKKGKYYYMDNSNKLIISRIEKMAIRSNNKDHQGKAKIRLTYKDKSEHLHTQQLD